MFKHLYWKREHLYLTGMAGKTWHLWFKFPTCTRQVSNCLSGVISWSSMLWFSKKKKLIFHVIIYSAEGEAFKNCRWNRRSFGIKEIFATWNGFWTSEDHFLFSSWLIQLNDISCRVVPPEFLIKCNQQNLLFHQAEALVKINAFSRKSQWYWLSCGSLDQIPRFIF